MTVNQLLRDAVDCPRESPRFAFVAPYLKQAKDIAWDYVHKFAGVIPGAEFNESELRVDLPGDRRIRLYGADNPDSIQGIYLDGCVMDEYQLTNPRLFGQIVRPMLADRQGWVIFAGKPLGHNHFYELYEAMQATPSRLTRLYRASETGILDEAELRDMRLGPPPMTDDEYAQELECSWEAAIRGAYYAKQLEETRKAGRITSVVYEPDRLVDTWWDLGWDDFTAIIFTQTIGREIRVIDYLQARHEPLAYYAKELQRRPYVYTEHHLPHDAKKTEQGSGKSLIEQLRGLGLQHLTVVRQVEVEEGIQAARALFPRVWFDAVKARQLVECLATYTQEWVEARHDFGQKPKHDAASHGADAFRYLAVGIREALGHVPGPRYARSGLVDYRDQRQAGAAARYATGSLS